MREATWFILLIAAAALMHPRPAPQVIIRPAPYSDTMEPVYLFDKEGFDMRNVI